MSHRALSVLFLCFLFNCSGLCQESVPLPTKMFNRLVGKCLEKQDVVRCFKIQAVKASDRALKIKSINVANGLDIVGNDRQEKYARGLNLKEEKLENLTSDDLDLLLADRTARFLESHRLNLDIPKLMDSAEKTVAEEGRGKKGQKHQHAALMAALAIKGSFLALAYKGIAVMSGTALIVGKMALLLAAILGLKKIVSGNHEKTTFEIIKTPKHTEEHHHSTTYEDEYHDHRRNYLVNAGNVQRRIYRFTIPE
ncbi:uncharacterized protein LOC115891695 [Sitophilus oryzae]|uniref:Uncharacterized protein LOC115891695 n=1 Tax=Sitophilus oryzae TaxID=7048 RepID=A0A6J2YZ45_SITOR|nr:uncharacterized protein LOC115891695 [Sitophilus oryzae]